MKKAMTLTVISALALMFCVALVSTLHSAPPDWANPGAKPLWKITDAIWVDHAPNPRFAVYDTGTPADDVVLDKETGLVWKKIPGTELKNWYYATDECIGEDAGGRMGWRLPTVEELLSLAVPTDSGGLSLPDDHPFTMNHSTQPSYWSSSTDKRFPDGAYLVCFAAAGGCLYNSHKKDDDNYVWCVRGGHGYDAY